MNKPWYTSKTIIVNIISLIIAILGFCVPIPGAGPILAVIISVLNIVLRFLTVLPIGK